MQQRVYPYDEPGVYDVTVSYLASNSTSFKIGRLGVNTFVVLNAGSFDVIGNPTSTFPRRQPIQVSASLKNTDIIPHTYIYIVQIRDVNARIIFIGWIHSAVEVGQTVRHPIAPS